MKPITALALLALILTACGTRPPLPPECKGPLSPINAASDAVNSGAVDAPGPRF